MPFMVKFKLLEELWTEPRHFVVEPTVAANLKYDISNGNSPYIHLISTFSIFIFEIRRVDNRLSSITSSNSFFKAHIIQYRLPGAWIAAEQFHQGEIRSSPSVAHELAHSLAHIYSWCLRQRDIVHDYTQSTLNDVSIHCRIYFVHMCRVNTNEQTLASCFVPSVYVSISATQSHYQI